jgi:nucleotide-binding universal stress UspA family protein
MSTNDERETPHKQPIAAPREPLSAEESQRAEVDALQQAGATTHGELMERRREARVEAETRRVSEEVTRAAQQRTAEEAHGAQSPAEAPMTNDTTASRSVASRSLPVSHPIQRVLVPLDGTPYAERAIPYALAVAGATGAALTLAHVAPPSPPHPAGVLHSVVGSIVVDAEQARVGDMATYMTRVRSRIGADIADVTVELSAARAPASALVETARRVGADVIVLASRAHEGIERRILGSVAHDLILHGNTPVLVVPPLATVPEQSEPSMRRVLVPLDGSLLAEQALGAAISLLRTPAKEIHASDSPRSELALLYVAESSASMGDGERYLRLLCDGLAASLPDDITLRAEAVLGSPPGAIVAAAASGIPHVPGSVRPYDVLAMATHGRGGLSHWVMGSVMEYVVPRSSIPVLIVHPWQTDM